MKRPGTRAGLRQSCSLVSASGCPASHPHHVHRRLPGRDREDVATLCGLRRRNSSSTTSASSPIPTRTARRPSRSTTTCRRGEDVAAEPGHASAEADRPGDASRGRIGERVRVTGRRTLGRSRSRAGKAGWRRRRRTSTRPSTSPKLTRRAFDLAASWTPKWSARRDTIWWRPVEDDRLTSGGPLSVCYTFVFGALV